MEGKAEGRVGGVVISRGYLVKWHYEVLRTATRADRRHQ